MVKVKMKKLTDNAVIPQYAQPGDAGLDLTCVSYEISADGVITYFTGLAMEIPEGYVGMLFPRSSVYKKHLILANSVGIIDSGYRGEVMFKYRWSDNLESDRIYGIGDRIGQIVVMPYPRVEIEESNNLSETTRGTGGYGSTGQ